MFSSDALISLGPYAAVTSNRAPSGGSAGYGQGSSSLLSFGRWVSADAGIEVTYLPMFCLARKKCLSTEMLCLLTR